MKRYQWKRFLCLRTDAYSVDPSGFPNDPDGDRDYAKILQPNLRTIAEIEEQQCAVILGEPGIGKSDTLETAHGERTQNRPEDGVVLYRNLNQYSTDSSLIQDIFQSPELRAWSENNEKLYLYLDSLDECLLRVDTVAQILVADCFCERWNEEDGRKAKSASRRVRERFSEIEAGAKKMSELGYTIIPRLLDCRYR